jgi:hypothetical protein
LSKEASDPFDGLRQLISMKIVELRDIGIQVYFDWVLRVIRFDKEFFDAFLDQDLSGDLVHESKRLEPPKLVIDLLKDPLPTDRILKLIFLIPDHLVLLFILFL